MKLWPSQLTDQTVQTKRLIHYARRLESPVPHRTAMSKLQLGNDDVLLWLWFAGVLSRTIKPHHHTKELVPHYHYRKDCDEHAAFTLLSDVLWSS